MEKGKKAFAIAVIALLCARLQAKVPTAEDLRRDILPLLIVNEITDIRMAGLQLDEKHPIVDLTAVDMSVWGEPGESTVSFRVRFRATEDIYGRPDASDTAEINLVRIGIAGKAYSASYEFDVKAETDEDESGELRTVFKFAESPYAGKFSWEGGEGVIDAGIRAAWEAQAAVTGETLRFFNSMRELEDQSK